MPKAQYKELLATRKFQFKKTRKMSNKLPNFTSKGIRKRRTNKAQSQQKEGNNIYQGRNKQRLKYNRKDQ